jgi:DNA (cytosine-5)-methyltransferase 1
MDPWAIVHWCTELRVRRLLVENVPEFVDWGPLDLRTGRPIKRRPGEYFRAWTAALQGAGFKLDWGVLYAADFGDATTRERFFLMARCDGKRVHWPDPTHSRAGEADLLGHGRHKWRAAREIIDWSIEGKSIFDRKRPLSRKTLARIYAGAVKFRWPAPFLVILRNHMDAQSVDEPVPTLCAGGSHIGLVQPFLLNRHGENGSTRAHDLNEPMPTADCRGAGAISASPLWRTSLTPVPTKAVAARSGNRCRRCTRAVGLMPWSSPLSCRARAAAHRARSAIRCRA